MEPYEIDEVALVDDCETLHMLACEFADETIDDETRMERLATLRAIVQRLHYELN